MSVTDSVGGIKYEGHSEIRPIERFDLPHNEGPPLHPVRHNLRATTVVCVRYFVTLKFVTIFTILPGVK